MEEPGGAVANGRDYFGLDSSNDVGHHVLAFSVSLIVQPCDVTLFGGKISVVRW